MRAFAPARADPPGDSERPSPRFFAFLLAVTLLIGGIGGYAFLRLRHGVQQDVERTLTMIAEQKRQQIEELMADARADVALFTTGNTQLATQLAHWKADGGRDPAPLQVMGARMGEVARQRGWLGLAVFDTELHPLLTIGEVDTRNHHEAARAALHQPDVQFIDLHRNGDGRVEYGVMAPIALRNGSALGVLYLTWGAARTLYPLVQSWPVPTRTAETFLVRREGEAVLFLTPLRQVPDAPMEYRQPLQLARRPAVQAVQGRYGLIAGGLDYRDQPVLAYATPIAGTPWAMIAKIDEDEAFAGLRATTLITALVMGLALLLSYGAGWLLWRQDRRRRAQSARQAQRAAEVRFYTMFEQLPLGVALADLSTGRLIEINRRFAAIVGRPAAELLKGDWTCFTHPEDVPPDREQMARLNAGEIESYHLNKRYLRPDGSLVWVSLTCAALRDDPQAGRRYLAIVEDITARIGMEAELRSTKERLEAMFSALPDLMFRVDRDGRIEEYHSAANDLLYLPPSQFLDRRVSEILPPSVAQVFMDAIAQAAIHGTHRGATYGLEMPRGQLWFELSVAAMGGEDLPRQDFIAVVRDITERRQAEAALRSAEERAMAASRAKSEFLAHMSHEIRTPLNGVLGLAQVLCREPLSDHQRGMVERIRESGESLLVILNDVLDFSKIEAGQLRLEFRPFDLGQLLARLDSLMGRSARAKGLGLHLELPLEPLGWLLGDALRLEQVLFNLVGNAVKFTARGEVVLRVEPRAADTANPRLRFTVRDTGIGIAPAALAGLFTPFTQADTGISRHYGGTGLGLSISKRLVELMGGEIGAESQPGQGSTFWCELPFARADAVTAAAAAPAAPLPPTGPRLAGLRLLVVDDSAMNREVVERALALEGATATPAADGQQALQLLKARPEGFAAVLMDVRMPVLDGLTATRLIRQELGLTGLPVIALTAGVMAEEQAAARAAGMDDVLTKPLDLEQLVACLLRWVGPGPQAAGPDGGTDQVPPVGPAPGVAVAPDRSDLPDLPGIDRDHVVRTLGLDRAFFLRVLERFVEGSADAVAQTRAALAQGARETASLRLHTLRGDAGNLGALDLMRSAGRVEEALARGETGAELEERLGALDRQLTDLLGAWAPWCIGPAEDAAGTPAGTPAGATPPLDPGQVEELRHALARNNAKARRVFNALEPALRASLGDETVRALGLAIRELRFQEALQLLDDHPLEAATPGTGGSAD